jgi:hypothetical protein
VRDDKQDRARKPLNIIILQLNQIMRKYPLKSLGNLRQDDKFIWKNIIYTVYQIEDNMVEVFDGKRFMAWPCQAKVTPVVI